MPEDFFSLSRQEQTDALGVAADRSGWPVHLLEKDAWVVWALEALFAAPFGRHLVFKGGTSLSKAYDVIARFSEDVDLTYDIRAIAPDLAEPGSEAIPTNQSQEQKWTKIIRARLDEWTEKTVVPASVESSVLPIASLDTGTTSSRWTKPAMRPQRSPLRDSCCEGTCAAPLTASVQDRRTPTHHERTGGLHSFRPCLAAVVAAAHKQVISAS